MLIICAHNNVQLQNPNCLVMVDNCYGEFAESIEPPMVVYDAAYTVIWYILIIYTTGTLAQCCWLLQGADLIAGSLIKNPGGTIAPCGGYVAGRKEWVAAAAARLSAPGLGVDCGSTPGDIMRTLFQGLFLGPQMVGEAIKVSTLSSNYSFMCSLSLFGPDFWGLLTREAISLLKSWLVKGTRCSQAPAPHDTM